MKVASELATLLLDTHVVLWLTAAPSRLSSKATTAIKQAGTLAVCAITWYELAWLASHNRISLGLPARSWLMALGEDLLTLSITPAISHTASSLPDSFPGDPADRLIYATAIEHGIQLVSKDRRLREHKFPRQLVVW
ncbi:MAG: type II toxin-antitoxin system VapC family toxin [Micrococcales bacterium]|nr:type II toxin-antitoxin system VapC family toxin [Micrococcales bacterium]